MLQDLVAFVSSSFFLNCIFAPLMSAVFGLLLSTNGGEGAPSVSERVVMKEKLVVYKERIVVERGGGGHSSDENLVYFVGCAFLVVGTTWFYGRYAEEIIDLWRVFLICFSVFSISSVFVYVFRYGLALGFLWIQIAANILVLICLIALTHFAHRGVIVGARDAAVSYGVFDFCFKVLSDQQRVHIVLQAFGVFVGIFSALLCVWRVFHFAALINSYRCSAWCEAWRAIVGRTVFIGSDWGFVMIVLLSVASYCFLDGLVYGWVMSM